MVRTLNSKQAWEVYKLIGNVPIEFTGDYLEYVNGVMHYLQEQGRAKDYLSLACILIDKPITEILATNPYNVLEWVIESLIKNKVIELLAFYNRL